MDIEYLFLTWHEYHVLAQKLAATILTHSTKPDEIVAISRGGLTLGHLMSDLLGLPISTFAIKSYTDIQACGDVEITQKLSNSITGKRILLVDDVADTGKTLLRAIKYLKSMHPASIETVTIFYKPHSDFRPDFFARQTEKWILFPYEPTEMISLITKKLSQEGLAKKEIQDFLVGLGYREGQIGFTRKHHLKTDR